MLPSSAPLPVWAWEFSCPYMVKLGPQTIVLHVCREHVFFFLCIKDEIINFINLLSLLGRMWVSYHHCFIVVGYTSCFYCMILLLSKPAWFCV